jgi:CheY-like chemotaxis protein
MKTLQPVLIIEDDEDDQELIRQAFADLQLGYYIVFFTDGKQAFDFLLHSAIEPFLIICDINMPLLNGFDLRRAIRRDKNLEIRCIPFVYLTTASNSKYIHEAYSLSIQGYFIKPFEYNLLKTMIKAIVDYWSMAVCPTVI